MHWFYALQGRQHGPVSEAELDQLIRSGAIRHDTLVWNEGLPNWQPLQAVRPIAPPMLSSTPAPPVLSPADRTPCAECGRTFPQTDMVFLSQAWVCAACKPVFLQRL